MTHKQDRISIGLFRATLYAALVLFLNGCITTTANAQILYASAINSGGVATIFYINLATCESCSITPASPNIGTDDFIMLPDGSHLNLAPGAIRRLEAPPSVAIIWQIGNAQEYLAGQLAPSGLVYLIGPPGLTTYNPANNTFTFIGPMPASVLEVYDIFYIDGVLYANGINQSGDPILIEINVGNTLLSTITPWSVGYTDGEGGNWNGAEGLFFADASHTIYFYNPQDGTVSTICDIDTQFSIISLTTLPPGLPDYPCISGCTSDAGELAQGGPFNTCVNSILNIPAATQTVVEAGDLLQYVLFSNPADTAGSIVAVSNTPAFSFAPPMQPAVTYYVAAVVGNDLNGNVDLNDPCLDFSNALEVVWQPLPTVQLATPNSDVCAGGCRTLDVVLTGTGPFVVTGNLLSGGNVIGTFSETLGGNTGTLILCVPGGIQPGSVTVQTTALTDAWCICE
ncbi:MAG: hypothetical protein IPM98_10010 [Lewinellaceae bacterium]|nr:hypothetical protein [Lewinellaceae bacterium]